MASQTDVKTKAAFTPGPWVWHPDFPTDVICSERGECSLATIDIGCGDKPEQNANARLIASAPELYEALEKAHRMLLAAVGRLPVVDEIKAALAKARGEV